MQCILFFATGKCADLMLSLTPYGIATVQKTGDHFNITIGTFHVTASLLCLQFDQNHFRAVVNPKRKDTVSDAAAHKHIGVAFRVNACVVFREQALIGCYQATDKWHAELTAMGMTTEDQV